MGGRTTSSDMWAMFGAGSGDGSVESQRTMTATGWVLPALGAATPRQCSHPHIEPNGAQSRAENADAEPPSPRALHAKHAAEQLLNACAAAGVRTPVSSSHGTSQSTARAGRASTTSRTSCSSPLKS